MLSVETPVTPSLLLHEKVRSLYTFSPLLLMSNMMAALLVFGILWAWTNVDQQRAVWWIGLVTLVVALRACLLLVYNRIPSRPATAALWGAAASVGTFMSGLLWGISPWMLFIDQTWFDLLMLGLLLMGAIGAGSVALLTPFLPAFYSYFLPSLVPFVYVLVGHGDPVRAGLAVGVVLYIGALSIFAHRAHRASTSSIEVRLENLNLVQELVRQKEEAEKSNIAKSRFLAAASHDLRQPMHALGLFVETLRERIHHPELRRIVDNIGASVEAMNDLFNALLDISRLDAGVIQPMPVDFSLLSLLERIRNEYEVPCAEKGLRLRVRPRQARVHSDPALVERILRNFVTNALRYTRKGGIMVGVRRGKNTWRLEVWDTGIGIPQDKQKDIFQEFVQLNNPERDRTRGLGLGLAIVDRLASLLNHPIIVRSRPGRGSLFAIELPMASGADPLPAETGGQGSAFTSFPGTLVIVVDDEAAILKGMMDLLHGWGCEVIIAGSGDELMAKLADCSRVPNLIISDYRLRGSETGVSVIQRLQEEFNVPIPGVLITGDTAPDRIQEARSSGFQLLHKPLQPARLRLLMTRLFSTQNTSSGW